MLECRLLGSPELTIGGAPPPAELLWRKHFALLILLVRAPRRTRARDQLIGMLWAEKEEKAARHSLREAIRIVRKALGDDGLETVGDRVTLKAPATTDVDQLDARLGEEDWEGAAALVAGPFLDGLVVPDAPAFDDWVTSVRHGLLAKGLRALTACAEARLARGRATAAVDAAHRALALDPGSDNAMRAVLRAYAIQGDRAAALAAWQAFRDRLAEVGATPAPRTAALVERIRAGRLPTVPPPRPDVPEVRRTPLIGRAAPLAALVAACREAWNGAGALFATIEGESGLGRSRLIEEVITRARLEGISVVAVRAVPADGAEPWSGLHGIAQGGLLEADGVAGASSPALARLAEGFPQWADRFRDARSDDPPGLPGAIREVMGAALDAQPMLLAIDDAHWLDAESGDWLEQLLRDQRTAPLAVLATFVRGTDAELTSALRRRLAQDNQHAGVQIEPLQAGELVDLVGEVFPNWTTDQRDRLARRLSVDSAGKPLLAVELLHAIALVGVEDGGAAWPVPARTLDQTFPGEFPEPVVLAVRAGFHDLDAPARAALGALASLGDRATLPELTRATGLAHGALETALDALEWRRWVAAESRGYSFVSRVVQQVVRDDLLTPGQVQRYQSAVT